MKNRSTKSTSHALQNIHQTGKSKAIICTNEPSCCFHCIIWDSQKEKKYILYQNVLVFKVKNLSYSKISYDKVFQYGLTSIRTFRKFIMTQLSENSSGTKFD